MKEHVVSDEKRKLEIGQHDNFPQGAVKTTHRFRTDAKLRTNEEMFVLTDDEIIPGEVLSPAVVKLPSQCCRLAFHMTKKQLATIFRVHGEGIQYYAGMAETDEEVSGQVDPEFGFQMDKPDEGYSCSELLPNGRCKHHPQGKTDMESGKPYWCKMFPFNPLQLKTFNVCSYTFIGDVRVGSCDGCKGKLGL